jgi:14-3-3 protein epsilon
MQLLRDNLTLWTSSDGNDAEPAAAADAPKDDKPAEEAPAAAPTETKVEDQPPAAAPSAA